MDSLVWGMLKKSLLLLLLKGIVIIQVLFFKSRLVSQSGKGRAPCEHTQDSLVSRMEKSVQMDEHGVMI